MLNPLYHNKFDKDIIRMRKRGKGIDKLKSVIRKLIDQEELSRNLKDQKLIGDFVGRRECHVEPDWLLVYRIENNDIIFERTGTHSDIF
ncbi:MAG: type II toxin-antitoxin system YafQ family toxin [Leptospirales bacterium]